MLASGRNSSGIARKPTPAAKTPRQYCAPGKIKFSPRATSTLSSATEDIAGGSYAGEKNVLF